LSATSNSSLSVSFISSNTSVIAINGSNANVLTTGFANITAIQSGDNNYSSASNIIQPLTINKSDQNITFSLNPTAYYNPNGIISLSASANSNLSVSFTSSNTNVANITGSNIIVGTTGFANITAIQLGNNNYNSAANVTQPLTINKANQLITFTLSPTTTYSPNKVISLVASANSNLSVTFTSSNTNVATISGSNINLLTTGFANITAIQSGDNNYNSATNVIQPLSINSGNQTITFTLSNSTVYGYNKIIPLTGTSDIFNSDITYYSSNTNVATISGANIIIKNTGLANITATQSGDINYYPAGNVIQPLTVTKSTQTITFNPPTQYVWGTNSNVITGSTTATYASNLSVNYLSDNTNIFTIVQTTNGNIVVPNHPGQANIICTQLGDNNYFAAPNVTVAVTVDKAPQTITSNIESSYNFFSAVSSNINLYPTSSSGLSVNLTSSNTSIANITNNVISFVSAGVIDITANQIGNDYYNPANVSVSGVTINVASTIIGNSTYLTNPVSVSAVTTNIKVKNINITIPDIQYTKPGVGAYGYQTGLTNLVSKFTVTTTDINLSTTKFYCSFLIDKHKIL
jgi:hypothetical protein